MSTLVSVSSERAKIPELEFSVPLLMSPLEILLPYRPYRHFYNFISQLISNLSSIRRCGLPYLHCLSVVEYSYGHSVGKISSTDFAMNTSF